MEKSIGISILTNGNRSGLLLRCVESFLSGCHYRPLVIAVFDNGSTDDTPIVCGKLPKQDDYGIMWRFSRSEIDLGCAAGTNAAHEMVGDCEYAIHLESDFEHLPESESGISPMWLREAIGFLDSGQCDYLYLRRMRTPQERAIHWFDQWKARYTRQVGPYQCCPGFWWSNNPSLRRVKALYDCKTLPLDVTKDGGKGTVNWSRPELETAKPTLAWLYGDGQGMFVHRGV